MNSPSPAGNAEPAATPPAPAGESSRCAGSSSHPAPILLDISRLIWRVPRTGPSGIDRIELEYARHFLATGTERPAYGVINYFGWLLAISPAGAQRFLRDLSARWNVAAATSPNGSTGAHHAPAPWAIYLRLAASAWSGGFWLRRKLRRHGGTPVFLVVSHHHLSRDEAMPRIRRAFGARGVCFLHDLIPIEYPEYFSASWQARGQRLVANAARQYDAVIVNSAATADSFRRYLEANPAGGPPRVRVAPPGIRAFVPPEPKYPPSPTALPYFVVLGTIEPRKNHLLLLNLWARLAKRDSATSERPPLLHVIGARGWENEQVVDMLERCHELRGLVIEHNGLDDGSVAQLLCGARALLLPSFVEGFGLPLAEALASGVPVICSDIPVFREVGGAAPEYLDPLDHFAWKHAVLDYYAAFSLRRIAQIQRIQAWKPPTWQDHFNIINETLAPLAAGSRECVGIGPDARRARV